MFRGIMGRRPSRYYQENTADYISALTNDMKLMEGGNACLSCAFEPIGHCAFVGHSSSDSFNSVLDRAVSGKTADTGFPADGGLYGKVEGSPVRL